MRFLRDTFADLRAMLGLAKAGARLTVWTPDNPLGGMA